MEYAKPLAGYEELLNCTAQYQAELGAEGIGPILQEVEAFLDQAVVRLNALKPKVTSQEEPWEYEKICALYRPCRIHGTLTHQDYLRRLRGAVIGRFAGCALGAPVEMVSVPQMEELSKMLNCAFPPEHYWPDAPSAYLPRYSVGYGRDFTLGNIHFLSPDDDIVYTLLSLLIMEQYGPDFTTENVAQIWKQELPPACTYTAERAVLTNLLAGMALPAATLSRNPYLNWIGGNIRCDGYGYVNPLDPYRAAELAYRDAILTHRNSGLYSAMYFAAAIALAFSDHPLKEVLEEALCVVPPDSSFYKTVRWALEESEHVRDYQDAVSLVDRRFAGMSIAHSENNACLTIFGVLLGESSYSAGIGQTVAMGHDNDCTAATAGSILGAHLGIDAIASQWYQCWNGRIKTFLNNTPWMELEDVISRFHTIAAAAHPGI